MQIITGSECDLPTEDLYCFPHNKLMAVQQLIEFAGHVDERVCFDHDQLHGLSSMIEDATLELKYLFIRLSAEKDAIQERHRRFRTRLAEAAEEYAGFDLIVRSVLSEDEKEAVHAN